MRNYVIAKALSFEGVGGPRAHVAPWPETLRLAIEAFLAAEIAYRVGEVAN
jgi:hypothetical protein